MRHFTRFAICAVLMSVGATSAHAQTSLSLTLDEAIQRFEAQDPELARLIKLLFFAGLSSAEAAEALGISERTVRRDWKLAKAWLTRELGEKC